MRPCRAFFSNTFSSLVEELAAKLTKRNSPFTKVSIYVSYSGLKSYLIESLASQFGIFSGIEIIHMDKGIKNIFGLLSKAEMSLHLEAILRECDKEENLISVKHYINDDPNGHKLRGLCDFLSIGCERHFLSNEKAFPEQWQKDVYLFCLKKIFKQKKSLEGDIYVFGCTTIPEKFLDLLVEHGAYFFLLSPCSLFWGDICSDKEKTFLHSLLKKQAQDALEGYLEGQHPFLANWGFAGKYAYMQLETRGVITEDSYKETSDSSALSTIKNNLLYMQEALFSKDDSLQLHSALSMRHEVEILYDRLCTLLATTSIKPSDIVIMAPDISCYAPFIHTIFHCIDYKIYDLEETYTFSALFTLALERFTKDAFFTLCQDATFLEKRGLQKEDFDLLQEWVKKIHISWGVDAHHRQLLFSEPLYQETGIGTWAHGFNLLLEAFSFLSPGQELHCELHEAEKLGTWIELIYDLKTDLLPVIEEKEKTLKEWIAYTRHLLSSYFAPSQELLFFIERLQQLLERSCYIQDHPFSFSSFYRLLEPEWKKGGRSFQAHHLESITCRSYGLYPAKVLCILGLDEESFPRKELYGFTDLPLKVDKDRFLFLEWILCAKTHLLLSYQEKKGAPHELIKYLGISPEHHALCRSPISRYAPLPQVEENHTERCINIRHLNELARHPMRFYLRYIQKIHLPFPENESEFSLSLPIKKRILRQALERPFDIVWDEAREKGYVPREPFGMLLQKELSTKAYERQGQLSDWGIDEVFSLSICPSEAICVTGKIPLISKQGMLVDGKKTMQNLFKAWPLFLVFCLHTSGEKKLLFIEDGKEKTAPQNPLDCLHLYFEYFAFAKKQISFLTPDWAAAFFKEKEINTTPFTLFYDPYLSFLERKEKNTDIINNFFLQHSTSLQKWFAPFITWSEDV